MYLALVNACNSNVIEPPKHVLLLPGMTGHNVNYVHQEKGLNQ
jgi:hypothetical protein